jgi:hypothetical protein
MFHGIPCNATLIPLSSFSGDCFIQFLQELYNKSFIVKVCDNDWNRVSPTITVVG